MANIPDYNKLVPRGSIDHSLPSTFTGADIKAIATIGTKIKVFAEMQTLSYSIHREKPSVMLMGRVNPVSFTRGPRTIAGSMVFTVFNREILEEFMTTYPDDAIDGDFGTVLIDQIPPFDITVTFLNEDGYLSSLVIYGVDIVDDGQTMSVNDMIIENMKGYKARGLDLMWMQENGVWQTTTSGQKRINSKAIFNTLPQNPYLLNPDEKIRQELQSKLQEISQLKDQIDAIETAISAITNGDRGNFNLLEYPGELNSTISSYNSFGTVTDSNYLNAIDFFNARLDVANSKLLVLQREASKIRATLNFSVRKDQIKDEYLKVDR